MNRRVFLGTLAGDLLADPLAAAVSYSNLVRPDHEGIAMITFTGSPPVGWGIRARAPRKRVGLELGNNAPVILEPDGDWKTAAAGRTQNKALPEPAAAMRDVQVRPDKSNNEITMKINQWAADTYPVAQKHLDTARTLENPTKKRTESSRDRR